MSSRAPPGGPGASSIGRSPRVGRSMDAPDSTDYAVWWLRIALGDLLTAAAILGDPALPPGGTAELAQQAAEKALKAAIALDGSEPPRTHDLVLLVQRVPVGVRISRPRCGPSLSALAL